MSVDLEKLLILTVISVFCLASLSFLDVRVHPVVSEEEAIEIAKNARLVKDGIATVIYWRGKDTSIPAATHYNISWVEQMKKGHSKEIVENVPEGHDIWQVSWYIPLISGYNVFVIVDAETGLIVHETKGVIEG